MLALLGELEQVGCGERDLIAANQLRLRRRAVDEQFDGFDRDAGVRVAANGRAITALRSECTFARRGFGSQSAFIHGRGLANLPGLAFHPGDRDAVTPAARARGDQRVVQVEHLAGGAVERDPAAVDQDRAFAQRVDRRGRVRDEQQRRSGRQELADPREALLLEEHVADGERLVDDQHVRPHRGRDAEREPDLHPARVGAHRFVEVVADVRERLDPGHRAVDLVVRHSGKQPGHPDVLPSGELGLEPHAEFEQRRDAPGGGHGAGGGLQHARDHLQQRALAGAVRADDADRFAGPDREADVLQHPVPLMPRAESEPLQQAVGASWITLVGLAQAAGLDRSHRQSSSVISAPRSRWILSPRKSPSAASSATHPSRANASGDGSVACSTTVW